jgi:predicted CoA-binding protein
MMIVDDVAGLRRVLLGNRVIAVVGLSPSWNRPSYFAAKYMLEHGYTIVPVNPAATEILGRKCYPDLASVPVKVDLVDVFRKPEDALPIAEEAIRIGAKCLWLQLGVINREAAEKASAAGLDVVMDRCVKIEYARLFGGLNFAGVNTGIISAKRPPCPPLQQ